MIHEDPRAYLLGMEGAALLRAFTGHHDREFVRARLAEVRRILDTPMDPVDVERAGAVEGYGLWAASYDGEDNGAFPLDTPVLTEVLDGIAPGPALDAAAGTGRLTRLLLDRGHRVTAVDSSPDMLGHNPADDTRVGDLRALPVGDAEVDVVVCGLALTHVPDLDPVFAEFARVLRPGGHLVLSEVHPDAVARGSVPTVRGRGNRPMRLVTHEHLLGDYLRAALAAGLELRRFTEPVPPPAPPREASTDPGPWDVWPWSLAAMVPEATRAATGGRPAMLVAHWRRG